ncbi:hypothetical protein vseg_000402 [Gypsophila vaccaria]
MSYKGKAVMTGGKDPTAVKNKHGVKRKNRDVLQFFEDAADEFDASDGSDWSDFFDDEEFLGDFKYNEDPKVESVPEKRDQVPFFPKEEELSGDELEKMLEERYKSGSGFVRYAEDDYDSKRSVDKSFYMPSVVEPKIWKVKCKVGREKNVVFCLIQKYLDLKVLGTKLQIISTFSVEHVKGFVFIEAEKQSDVAEACYQLADVYGTLVVLVPSNEVGQLLNVRRKTNEVKEGTWARVKNGIYRGDLTQVVAVNNERKRATVKLIPRVDIQALMEKYGGGSSLKRPRNSVPTARLICSRELAELRPLIQYRRDRDTGKVFEFLDGLMLKDGFLFKKMSFDSLAFWDVNPTEEELQKFALPSHDESDNVEWLSQLYGEQKKKCDVKIVGKGGGKGEGSSGSNEQSGFEVHDLVLFGKREFGMVIGMDKDEKYKVLKDSPDGSVTLTFGPKELKYVPVDTKFTASDHRMKTISINDTVKILDGPSKEKQGIVKQIYRGIIFVYDENDLENAYFCSKSKMSEKVKNSDAACLGKDEGGHSTFEDIPSSPKSPLSPKKPWQSRENGSDDRGDQGAIFSVGQSLRIRVGPLKGYLCRVLAVRYSEVTVKLDSKQKVLTVKREHLAEVRGKNSTSASDDAVLGSSFKPFDLLGADGGANDWLQGASGSADGGGGGWNVGSSNERSTGAAGSSWGTSVQEGATAAALPDSANKDSGLENDSWLTKVGSSQNDSDAAWGKRADAGASNSWGKPKDSVGDVAVSWNVNGSSSGQGSAGNVAAEAWDNKAKVPEGTSSWGDKTIVEGSAGSWSNKNSVEGASGWNKLSASADAGSSGWGKQKACDMNANLEKSTGNPPDDSWGKAAGGFKSGSENKGWGSSSLSPSSDKKEWGNSSGSLTNSQEGNTVAGWGDAGGQKSWDGSGQAKTDGWKAKSLGGDSASGDQGWQKNEGGSSWGNSSAGGSSWGKSESGGGFENDRGFNGGRGSGGRRGRGGDQYGRGRGRGRSFDGGRSSSNEDGQNNYSSGNQGWKKNEGGSSWGNSSAGGSSWGKSESGGGGAEGGSSWGKSQSGGGGADGGSSWGKPQSGGGGADGGSSWGKPQSGGSSAGGGGSWGKSDGSGAGRGRSGGGSADGGSSWGKPQSGSGGADGGSSWGNPQSGGGGADGGSSWGKPQSGGSSAGGGGSWGKSDGSGAGGGRSGGGSADGGSSWGKPQSGGSGAGGGGSWGKTDDSGAGGGGSGRSGAEGGSSWGNPQSGGSGAGGGGSWGKSDGSGAGGRDGGLGGSGAEGGSSWGKPQSGGGGADGGSSWGKPPSGGSGAGGGGSWGKADDSGARGGGSSGSGAEGGSSWGKSESGGGGAAGGGSSWGKSQSKEGNKAGEGRSSWGSGGSNDQINLNKTAGPSGNSSEGGVSWGQPSSGGSSWGNAQKSGNSGGGGGGWGK